MCVCKTHKNTERSTPNFLWSAHQTVTQHLFGLGVCEAVRLYNLFQLLPPESHPHARQGVGEEIPAWLSSSPGCAPAPAPGRGCAPPPPRPAPPAPRSCAGCWSARTHYQGFRVSPAKPYTLLPRAGVAQALPLRCSRQGCSPSCSRSLTAAKLRGWLVCTHPAQLPRTAAPPPNAPGMGGPGCALALHPAGMQPAHAGPRQRQSCALRTLSVRARCASAKVGHLVH